MNRHQRRSQKATGTDQTIEAACTDCKAVFHRMSAGESRRPGSKVLVDRAFRRHRAVACPGPRAVG